MRALDARDKGISMRVIERLANGNQEEGRHEESKGRHPGAQRMGCNLKNGAEGEHGAQVEVLAQMGVGQGGNNPAGKGGPVAVRRVVSFPAGQTDSIEREAEAGGTYMLETMAVLTLYSRIT